MPAATSLHEDVRLPMLLLLLLLLLMLLLLMLLLLLLITKAAYRIMRRGHLHDLR
jgi:hypothetical protein